MEFIPASNNFVTILFIYLISIVSQIHWERGAGLKNLYGRTIVCRNFSSPPPKFALPHPYFLKVCIFQFFGGWGNVPYTPPPPTCYAFQLN